MHPRSRTPQVARTASLFRNWYRSPAGGPTGAGLIRASRGVPERPRVFGSHALVYLVHGSGIYTDPHGDRDMKAGDLIVIDPQVPHWYGPKHQERWDEFYLVFEGPVFDAWSTAGLLYQPGRRWQLHPVDHWYPRLCSAFGEGNRGDTRHALDELVTLQHLLTQILSHQDGHPRDQEWLATARDHIDAGLSDRATAGALGIAYDTFRRRFSRLAGMPPSRYRTSRTMETACRLLVADNRPLKSIARELGFYDEFHFSRRFRSIIGQTPTEFRRSYGSTTTIKPPAPRPRA